MKRNLSITLFTGMLITLMSGISLAQGPCRGEESMNFQGRKQAVEQRLNSLNLNDKQKTEIKKLRNNNKNKARQNRTEIKKLHQQMHTEWQKDNPDKNKILSLHSKINNLKGQMGKQRIEMRFAIRKILTKSQRQQFKTMMKQSGHMNQGLNGQKGNRHGKKCHGKKGRRGNGQNRNNMYQ